MGQAKGLLVALGQGRSCAEQFQQKMAFVIVLCGTGDLTDWAASLPAVPSPAQLLVQGGVVPQRQLPAKVN